jgi:hypothetical protein
MSHTSKPAARNLRFAFVRLRPLTAGTVAVDGVGDADGVSLGLAAGVVAVVAAGSTGTRKKIPNRRTVTPVTCLHHRRGPLTSPQTNKPQRQAEQKSGDDGEPGLPPRSGARRRSRRFNGARVSYARRCGERSARPVVAIPIAHSLRIRWIGIPSRWVLFWPLMIASATPVPRIALAVVLRGALARIRTVVFQ